MLNFIKQYILIGKTVCFLAIAVTSLSLTAFPVNGQVVFDFRGELAAWGIAGSGDVDSGEAGLRYLPMLTFDYPMNDTLTLDGEFSANLYGVSMEQEEAERKTEQDTKAYRAWVRFFSASFEARAGLQEISFGPGRLLRSLRWFDQKDSRDPTGFTDGVNALLLRYYFPSNANAWCWVLHGNGDPMGISPFGTTQGQNEFGGRFQFPVEWATGEIGLSFHHRNIDPGPVLDGVIPIDSDLEENRLGIDLRGNMGIGFWMESSHLFLEENDVIPAKQRFTTLGADYTFNLGNGITTLMEMMDIQLDSENPYGADEAYRLIALSGSYPLSLLNTLQVLTIRETSSGISQSRIGWKHTRDTVIIDCILFHVEGAEGNSGAGMPGITVENGVSDYGLRLVVQVNH